MKIKVLCALLLLFFPTFGLDVEGLYKQKPEQVRAAIGGEYAKPEFSVKRIATAQGKFYLRFNPAGFLNDFSFSFKTALSAEAAEKLVMRDWDLAKTLQNVKKYTSADGVAWIDLPGKIRRITMEKNGDGNVSTISVSFRIGWDES